MLVGCAALSWSQPGFSQTATWISPTTYGDWFDPTNWSTGLVPVAPTQALVPDFYNTVIAQPGAAAAAINLEQFGGVLFQGTGSAGGMTINALNHLGGNGAALIFQDTSTAAQSTINLSGTGSTLFNDAQANFQGNSTAGNATLTTANSAQIGFYDSSNAATASIINNSGGMTVFVGSSSAGSATITNNVGGVTSFSEQATGDGATIVNNAGGVVDISLKDAAYGGDGGVSVGSISGAGNIYLGASVLTLGAQGSADVISGVIADGFSPQLQAFLVENGVDPAPLSGGSLVKTGAGTLTLSGANTYTGGTTISAGTLSVSNDANLGAASGLLVLAGGVLQTTASFGTSRITNLDPAGGTIETAAGTDLTHNGPISGVGSLTKTGTGSLTLGGTSNTYTGVTQVNAGVLRAAVNNSLSPLSSVVTAAGATVDLNGHSQVVNGVTNAGTISLVGPLPGATLTVRSAWIGNGGVLRLGTALGDSTSVSDRLVLNGAAATASGTTNLQITNLGGLGALTLGNGIEVVSALNGATTTAQTTRDAFLLSGGHVDAGAYEYRLYAADASGAGESWYLRSTVPPPPPPPPPPVPPAPPAPAPNPPPAPPAPSPPPPAPAPPAPAPAPIPAYRAEVPMVAALPEQMRQANLAVLGNLHLRIGDEPDGSAPSRRSWARLISEDRQIDQAGTVTPSSDGRFSGFQAGTDLWALPNWRAGVYVAQVDADMTVSGFARGVQNVQVGTNDLRSQYLGAYATWMDATGFYLDGVLQAGRNRASVEPNAIAANAVHGHSALASLELGQSFGISSGWFVEPQVQVAYQRIDVDDISIPGATIRQDADNGWIMRLGVRVGGNFATRSGIFQPYARVNYYRGSSGTDVATFIGPAGSADIATRIGGASTELATGLTWQLSPATSLYGEIGKLWSASGNTDLRSALNASLGVKVRWQ